MIERAGANFSNMSLQLSTANEFCILLNCVANYCSQVEWLEINCKHPTYDTIIDQTVIKRHGLKKLIISNYKPSSNQFKHISTQFPYLDILSLRGYFIQYLFASETLFSVNMPKISLECLEIDATKDNLENIDGIYIKLNIEVIGQETGCCFLVRIEKESEAISDNTFALMENPNETIYEDSLANQNILNCHINCKSLNKLRIEYCAQNGSVNVCTATFKN